MIKTLVLVTVWVVFNYSSDVDARSFFPEHNLRIDKEKNSNVSRDDFNEVIDEVVEAYKDVVASHGGMLVANKLWDDPEINAQASRKGSTWILDMYGGLARHPEVTKDGFTLVVCHELGHHLGGYPFVGASWESSEGQSDYFATQSCARRLWGHKHAENAKFTNEVHPVAKERCDSVWASAEEQALCYRISVASEGQGRFDAELRKQPAVSYDNPDLSQVDFIRGAMHPSAQCRVDTYIAGALCDVDFDLGLIPGRAHGNYGLLAETEMAMSSCTRAAKDLEGLRPRCWYKPYLEKLVKVEKVQINDPAGNRNGVIEPNEVVEVAFELKNLAPRRYGNVTAKMKSSKEISVLQDEVFYGEISAQNRSAQTPFFKFKTQNLACGQKFDVEFSLQLKEARTVKLEHTLQVGQLVEGEPVRSQEKHEIPDNDPQGVDSRIGVNVGSSPVAKLFVMVDIKHISSGELKVILKSPGGREFVLRGIEGGRETDLKETFALDLPPGLQANGDWTLNISDHGQRDSGFLNAWELKPVKAVCDSVDI